MMTYQEASQLPKSEKITLITCESTARVKIFEQHSGLIYKRVTDYFVKDLKLDGISLEQANDLSELLTTDNWFYEIETKTLYVNVGGNPKEYNLTVVYKHFFSTAPVILPHDLISGDDVEWLPIVTSIGAIGQRLDDENTGIVLESQSQIDFINDGFWDSLFDRHIFENQSVDFYSWFTGVSILNAKRIFNGVVESKEFSSTKVVFRVKDFVHRLRNQVNLTLFSELDGKVPESIIGTPKRRIYGQVRQVKCVPIDAVLDGFDLTGTITITSGSNAIIGIGTDFLDELSPSDELIFQVQGELVKFTVDTIISNTSATLAKNSETSFVSLPCKVRPQISPRFKNRRWHIAEHKLRQSSATITEIINARTYKVNDPSEFFPNDVVTVLGQVTQVTRVSGDTIILEQNLGSIPIVGTFILRRPLTGIHFGETELIFGRDVSLTNTTEAILEIDDLAEFNVAKERKTTVPLQFTIGSPTITTSSTIDLRTIVKPRDWIRKLTQADATILYEILSVQEQSITLRTNYGFASGLEVGLFKNINPITDDSLILVDCYGKDAADAFTSNSWIKTASDCVLDLIENDAGFDNIDAASFDQAEIDCPFTISLVIPENIGDETPSIRDVISKINESVFGSLYGNSSQDIAYSIVNTRRPQDILPIKDDDIISWNVQTNQKIVNKVKLNYAPFVDKTLGSGGFKSLTYTNAFVDENIGIVETKEKTVYLFNDSETEIISQRIAFYNSLSQSVLTLVGKANFFTSAVNDRVYINLDRLYKRFGGDFNRKIGVVSGVKISQFNSEITMNDLGNVFNRCPTIAPNTTNVFTSSTEDEKIKFGYILDNDTLTPNASSEEALGSHLVG